MGPASSKQRSTQPKTAVPLPEGTSGGTPSMPMRDQFVFGVPIMDPSSRDDTRSFPLDGVDLETVSNERLVELYDTAPVIFRCGVRVVRLSKTLVLKGGDTVTPGEAETMTFAAVHTQIRVPRVYRTFKQHIQDGIVSYDGRFIVMDYIPGQRIDECWDSLNDSAKKNVTTQVAAMIEQMQSMTLNHLPPGPIGGTSGAPLEGCWFSTYGAGPFETLQDLEDWCNHKLDVCLRFKQAPVDTPRFTFRDIVLTHQDIAPRNILLDDEERVWLIDWGYAGVYPKGFEHAAIAVQARNKEFSELVLSQLSSRHEKETRQHLNIRYGLTTGALL